MATKWCLCLGCSHLIGSVDDECFKGHNLNGILETVIQEFGETCACKDFFSRYPETPQPDLSAMMEMVAERQISFHFQKNTEGTLHYTTEGKPYYSDDSYWSCNLVNGYNGDEYNGEGPTPAAALAAAIEEMRK